MINFSKILLFITLTLNCNAQLKSSKIFQNSQKNTSEYQRFVLVDFWATWCSPCITAKNYLSALQSQFQSELLVVSISRESPSIIDRFLKKHPTGLMVINDFESQSFQHYNVSVLPYSVLLNSEMKIVWEGNPTDLKPDQLEYYLSSTSKPTSINNFIELQRYKSEDKFEEFNDNSFQLNPLHLKTVQGLSISRNSKNVVLKANLGTIFSFLLKIPEAFISINNDINIPYELNYSHDVEDIDVINKLASILNLEINEVEEETDALRLQFNNGTSKLWSNDQIDWGDDSPQFLVDDNQFSADNTSIKDFAYKLSYLLKIMVFFENSDDNTSSSTYDWKVHYKFYNLMTDDLKENYGIRVDKVRTRTNNYTIRKKG